MACRPAVLTTSVPVPHAPASGLLLHVLAQPGESPKSQKKNPRHSQKPTPLRKQQLPQSTPPVIRRTRTRINRVQGGAPTRQARRPPHARPCPPPQEHGAVQRSRTRARERPAQHVRHDQRLPRRIGRLLRLPYRPGLPLRLPPRLFGQGPQTPLPQIWRNSKLFADLRDDSNLEGKCGLCEYKRVCMGCRARAFSEEGSYLAEAPNCDFIPVRIRGILSI